MNLVSKLGIGLAVILACLVTGGLAGYKMGKAVQSETDQSTISTMSKQVAAAQEDAKTFSDQLALQNQASANAKAEAAAQQAKAAQLQTKLDASQAQYEKDQKAWTSKLDAAAKTSTCSVLQENLCDSVMDY